MLAAGRPDGAGAEFRLFAEPPLLAGPAYYAALPARIARELRAFRPDVVVAQGAHETAAALAARKLAGVDEAVIADVHGDFRAPTRLYDRLCARCSTRSPTGSRARHFDAPTLSGRFPTSRAGSCARRVEPARVPAYVDATTFRDRAVAPLPDRPRALFVGVLERYKNVDGLAAARRLVERRRAGRALRDHRASGASDRLVEPLVPRPARADVVGRAAARAEGDRRRARRCRPRSCLPSFSEGLPRDRDGGVSHAAGRRRQSAPAAFPTSSRTA